MRKLMLPLAAAAVAALGVSAPAAHALTAKGAIKIANAAVKPLKDVLEGQDAAIKRNGTAIANVESAVGTLQAQVKGILDAATNQILPGLTALKDGLTALKDGVQGPNVAGQLGAAGTSLPGAANTATPSALPTGTVYRQIVLAVGGAGAGAPIGARTWIKLPEVAATGYTNNSWVCTSSGATGVFGGAYNAQAACPAGFQS